MSGLQLFEALDPATEAALRASIDRFGVLVAVTKARCPGNAELHGEILDGHHRSRIANDLGVRFDESWVDVDDKADAEAIARTLNTDRRHLTVEQRQPVVHALREGGHSNVAIAQALGVDEKTVRNDLSGSDISEPDRVRGVDGKSYPAKRKAKVHVKPSESKRAAEALDIDAPLAAGVVVDLKRAERVGREHQAEQRRSEPVVIPDIDDVRIVHGDFREVFQDEVFPLGVIITDPPYPREFLPLWGDLARCGLAWGCDVLVAMSGQTLLPDVIAQILEARDPITGHPWTYRWCGAYLTSGPATRVHHAAVSTSWKPVVIFDCETERQSLTTDVFESKADDKRHHHWGQSESGIAQLIEAFTRPGDLVIDPFLGGGTTALVARDLGRRFIGCDVDAAAIAATLERLA